jgi:hypothetical protein
MYAAMLIDQKGSPGRRGLQDPVNPSGGMGFMRKVIAVATLSIAVLGATSACAEF